MKVHWTDEALSHLDNIYRYIGGYEGGLEMATVKPIRTEKDYEAALARVDELMDAELGSPEGDELDVLVDLVELYESKHEPMGYPSPLAAIEFRMDQGGPATKEDI